MSSIKTSLNIILWMVCLGYFPVAAQPPVKYHISFPNIAHHEAEVIIEFSNIEKDQPLWLWMSRSSPGRYALHEFAKNVYNVQAFDRSGSRLEIDRPDVYRWHIKPREDYVRIKYTVFGDHCDGTYLALDNSHAHINIPATFMWAEGFEQVPVEIRFEPPQKEWKVATQLFATDDPYLFRAPNLDYFMDSPAELSDFRMREWKVTSGGKSYNMRMAVHHQESDTVLSAIEKGTRALVSEHFKVFGEWPDFDNGSYIFIGCMLPFATFDGMEHRNSTIITWGRPLSSDYIRIFDVVSHEFFHSWNVERLRPRSLQPFDFTKTNISAELWFGEGFSNYYSGLVMARSGIYGLDAYGDNLTRMLNYIENRPGLKINNAVQMSQHAPFVDAGRSVDPNNFSNTYISYYVIGEAIALGLDLTIRQKFPGLSLDDFMRAAWQKFGKNEIPFSNDDLEKLLAGLTGDASFAADFFNQYIHGHELPDYSKLLSRGGFILQRSRMDSASIGRVQLDFDNGKMIINSQTLKGTAIYQAGLDAGDSILSIAGDTVTGFEEWQLWLGQHKPGDTVEVIYKSRGIYKKSLLLLQGDPEIEIITFERNGRDITDEINNFRKNWLGFNGGQNPYELRRYCRQCGRAYPFRQENCSDDGSELTLTP